MKKYIKNGLTYKITDALYKKLLEAGENNTTSPVGATQGNSNPQDQNNPQATNPATFDGSSDYSSFTGNTQSIEDVKKVIEENLDKNLPNMSYLNSVIKNEENITGQKVDFKKKYDVIKHFVTELLLDLHSSKKLNMTGSFDETMENVYRTMQNEMLIKKYITTLADYEAIRRSKSPMIVATKFCTDILWAMSNGVVGQQSENISDATIRKHLEDFITYIQILPVDDRGSPNGNIINDNFVIPNDYKYWVEVVKGKNCLKMDLTKVTILRNENLELLHVITRDPSDSHDTSYSKEKEGKYGHSLDQEEKDVTHILQSDDNLKQAFKEIISNYSVNNAGNGKFIVQFFDDESCNNLLCEINLDINTLKDTSLQPIDFDHMARFGYNKELESIDSALRNLIEGEYISQKAAFDDKYNEISKNINQKVQEFAELIKIDDPQKLNPKEFLLKINNNVKKKLVKGSYNFRDASTIATELYGTSSNTSYDDSVNISFSLYKKSIITFMEFKPHFLNYSKTIENELNKIIKENSIQTKREDDDFSFNDEKYNIAKNGDGLYNLENTKGNENVIGTYLNFLKSFFGVDDSINEGKDVNLNKIKDGYYISCMLLVTYRIFNLVLVNGWKKLSNEEKTKISNLSVMKENSVDGFEDFREIMNRDPEAKDIELYDRVSNQLNIAKNLVERIQESLIKVLMQKGVITQSWAKEYMWSKIDFSNKFNLMNWFNNDDNMKDKVLKMKQIQNSFLKSAIAYAYLTDENEKNPTKVSKAIIKKNKSNLITFDKLGSVFLNLDIVTNVSPSLFYQSIIESDLFANEFRTVDPLFTTEGNQNIIYVPIAKQSGKVFCLIRIKKLFGIWRS